MWQKHLLKLITCSEKEGGGVFFKTIMLWTCGYKDIMDSQQEAHASICRDDIATYIISLFLPKVEHNNNF